MSDLFGGTLGFTPAFTGQQIANQTGAGAASAFVGGMNAGTSRKNQGLQQERFEFQKQQYNDSMDRLKAFGFYLNDGMPE